MRSIQLLLFVFSFSLASCSFQVPQNVLEPEGFDKLSKEIKGSVIIDVRTPEEFNQGFIENAINIDYRGIEFDRQISELDTVKTYFVYCKSGGRSSSAAFYMRRHGFDNVYELKGGIENWKKKGLPVIAGKMES